VLARAADRAAIAEIAPRAEIAELREAGYSAGELFELASAARRLRLDLLHLPHYLMPVAAPCPVVVTVHDLIHLRLPRTWAHRLYARWMLRRVRRGARLTLTPSRATARDLVELAGFDPLRVRVVPHGVPGAFASSAPPAGEVEAFRRRHGLRTPCALHVTNGLPHKGLDWLLRAWRGLPEVQLVLAGTGCDRLEVRARLAADDAARAATVLLGVLGDRELALAYHAASVVVVPSLLEGFGFPALEAMASGVPVVASDAGSLPEIVGDAGIIVPAGCVDKLKNAVYTVIFAIESAKREGLIQRALARSRRFSWEEAAQATFAAYEQALGNAP